MYNEYQNKYFSILGDSISTFAGYSEPEDAVYYDTTHKLASGVITFADTWWGAVIDRLGGNLLVNNSFSGSTVCWRRSFEIASYACSDKRTSALDREGILPDVIMVYIGTNDWGSGFQVSPGEHIGQDANDRSLFCGAYSLMLKKLRANYPQAEIWCFTLPISCCTANDGFEFPYYYGGRHISEYCNAIRSCAAEYGCRLIDLNSSVVAYDTMDGFHPTVNGMNTIADAVVCELGKQPVQ